ncbi:MAG: hypothetical protein ABEJ40_06835 [Haloarculaceae archaeon]
MASEPDEMADQGKLLFGAGFVFGVMTTLVMLGVVLVVTVRSRADVTLTQSSLLATLVGGVVFTGIVGIGLYYLAFPDNRTRFAIDPGQFGIDEEE